MKVCFATHQAAALTHGGIRTQMLQTKAGLEALGVSIEEFDSRTPPEVGSFDVVHVFTANIATYHLARALRLQGIPLVVTPVFFTRRPAGAVRSVVAMDRIVNRFARGFWTDYGMMAEMCGWASAVLPNTEAEADLFAGGLGVPRDRITVIPNGVEVRFAGASPELFHQKYGREKFVLSVTHLGPERKNALRLIEALEGVDRPAVIIGPVDESPYGRGCVERAARNPRLKLLGAVPHESELLASAYAACEVFVLPSLFETPGIAALEAATAGAKIVITGSGGTREYFGTDAEYVDPSSVVDIRNGIHRSLNRPGNAELRKEIGAKYSWRAVAEQTLAVYERVLSHRP
jgi:glycosyltransferase involved in cell wall biosynthesis